MKNQRKEERKRFRKVFLMIPMLFLTIAGLSVATYAYWVSTASDNASGNIEIGNGDTELVVSLDVAEHNPLIPSRYATDSFSGRDRVAITITANWTGEGTFTGDVGMSYEFNSIGIYTSEDLKEMFKLEMDIEEVEISTSDVNFPITFTLTFYAEPLDETIYNAIKDKSIVVNVTITVTPN